MGHYPFTAFNGVTAVLMLLTVWLIWKRVRGSLAANWPLLFYAAVLAYTIGFSGGLNIYWVLGAVACGLAVRFNLGRRWLRWIEIAPLAYIFWRCLGLILMW